MKKRKSHKLKRIKTFDEAMKGKKRGKLKILESLSPVPHAPAAIKMQQDLMSNKIDSTKVFFVPPSGM